MESNATDLMRRLLFAGKATCAYAVLESLVLPNLLKLLEEHAPRHACLRRGVEELPGPILTLPYLVRLEPRSPFTEWALSAVLATHWGILAVAPDRFPFIDLRHHFRDMLRVSLPGGDQVFSRYYLPCSINILLPTFDPVQLREFFGPVDLYLVENGTGDEEPSGLMQYSLELGALKQKFLPSAP